MRAPYNHPAGNLQSSSPSRDSGVIELREVRQLPGATKLVNRGS